HGERGPPGDHPLRRTGREVHRGAAQQRRLRRDGRAHDRYQRARSAHEDHDGDRPRAGAARLAHQDRRPAGAGRRHRLRRTWRDAHAGGDQADEAVPRRRLPCPARRQGILARRDPHHVPDRLVRGADRDARLGRAQLRSVVPAARHQVALSDRGCLLGPCRRLPRRRRYGEMTKPPVRRRGASINPPNRYEQLRFEADEPSDGDEPTVYYRDASKSVLAENDSPDVGFRFSLNPYRGCEHGCIYCLRGDTPVLYADLRWRPIGNVQVGDVIAGFDEHPEPGRTRKLRMAVVEAVRWSMRPTLRLVGERGEVVTTAEHLWLQARDCRWTRTDRLAPGRSLRHVPLVSPEAVDDDYRVGYLAGVSLRDGAFRYEPGWRRDKRGFRAAYWRIALADDEPLERVVEYLACFAVPAEMRPFYGGPLSRRPMRKVEIRSLARLAVIHGMITADRETRSYRRGFVAGFFDAEGQNGTSLRLSQKDLGVLERVQRYGSSLGFDFVVEPRPGRASTLRLVGGMLERMRFFSICRPAIWRKTDALFGREMNCAPETIRAI